MMSRVLTLPIIASLVLSLGCAASGDPSNTGAGGSGSGGSGAAGQGGGANGGSGGSGSTGDGAIGSACSTDADCTDPPAECWTTIGGGPAPTITFPGGFCSKGCDPQSGEAECGDVASCAQTSVSGGMSSVTLTMCTPPCASDAECRAAEGYKCLQLFPGIGFCTL